MNQPFKLSFSGLCGIALLAGTCFFSCKGPGEEKHDDMDSILQKPPFSALTDSIRQSAPAAAAGLYLRRGDLLSQLNMHEIAVNDYKRSWEIRPEEETGLHYASTLSIIGRTGEAVNLLEDCLKRFPANSSFASLLGDIYVQSGRTKEALRLYDNVLAADSSNFEAWYEKGLLLEKARE